LVANLNSVSAQSDLAESLNSIFGSNETDSAVTNLSETMQQLVNPPDTAPPQLTIEGNKTCNVPVEKPAINNISLGLVATKSVEPHELIAYGLNPQNSTLAENATVTISIKGFGGVSEKKSAVDVVFSIDGSGSMEQNDPNNLRIAAAKSFIDSLNPQQDAAGMISWSSKLDLQDGLSSDFNSIKSELDNIQRKAGTNLNIGITGAIEMLDKGSANSQSNPTKSIILLTDGKGEYTKSGMPGSPADEAMSKGYKIFPIGLNVAGTDAEIDLKDIASATGGQYFSAPTAENLDLVFNQIFQKVVSITAPSNISILEATPSYIVVHENSSSIPLSNIVQDEDKTILQWDDVSRFVGNQDSNLDQNETFTVQFKISSSRQGVSVPVELDPNAYVSFVDSSGQNMTVPIPQAYLDVRAPGVSPTGDSTQISGISSTEGFWIKTDKPSFNYNEDIYLYGNVSNRIEGQDTVRVMICNDEGKAVDEGGTYEVNLDGSFMGSYSWPTQIATWFLGGSDLFNIQGNRSMILDQYLYAEYGNETAFAKYKTTGSHIQVGPNPESGITLKTDKTFYSPGETVNVTGDVGEVVFSRDVRLDLYSQLGDFIVTRQAPVQEDGSFSHSLDFIPYPISNLGTYVVEATYDGKSAETKYQIR
jgi:Ca-activated chloride channel family protein